MGDPTLCPDHIDLLAASGHEADVLRLIGNWLSRPGERLLDLRGVRGGSMLAEVLPGRVRREPIASAPYVPAARQRRGIPGHADLPFQAEDSYFRDPPRGRRGESPDDPGPSSSLGPRGPARPAPSTVEGSFSVSVLLRSLRRRVRGRYRVRRGGRPPARDRRPRRRHCARVRGCGTRPARIRAPGSLDHNGRT